MWKQLFKLKLSLQNAKLMLPCASKSIALCQYTLLDHNHSELGFHSSYYIQKNYYRTSKRLEKSKVGLKTNNSIGKENLDAQQSPQKPDKPGNYSYLEWILASDTTRDWIKQEIEAREKIIEKLEQEIKMNAAVRELEMKKQTLKTLLSMKELEVAKMLRAAIIKKSKAEMQNPAGLKETKKLKKVSNNENRKAVANRIEK